MFVRFFLAIINVIIMIALSACSCERFVGGQATTPKFVIVNVLDKESFDDCHIQGSINVPFMDLKEYALKRWNKDTTEIVLHCSNYLCTASGDGYTMLTKLGFKRVWAFEGGTAEAKQFGISVVGACQQSYLVNYQKPEMYAEKKSVAVISVEDLKKKIEEFAIH